MEQVVQSRACLGFGLAALAALVYVYTRVLLLSALAALVYVYTRVLLLAALVYVYTRVLLWLL